MSSPPSSEGDPPDGGESSSSKNEAAAAAAEATAAAAAGAGDDEMEDIKQFVIRSSQNLKSDSPEGEVEGDAKPSPSPTSKQLKEEVKKEEELRDEKERGLPPPLPQPKMYVMPKTTAATAAEKSPASTLSGQLPPPATRQITIRAPTVQKAGIGPKIHLQQNIQVPFSAIDLNASGLYGVKTKSL